MIQATAMSVSGSHYIHHDVPALSTVEPTAVGLVSIADLIAKDRHVIAQIRTIAWHEALKRRAARTHPAVVMP
jgi:hypothetical protein